MALTDKLSAIGDAVRNKTGFSDLMTLDQMATAIDNIQIQQPFDLNAINSVLNNIQFCCPNIKRQGENWTWLGASIDSVTIDYGVSTIHRGGSASTFNSTRVRETIELPSFDIPENYYFKFDYDVRWYHSDGNSDYGGHSIYLQLINNYSDNTKDVQNIYSSGTTLNTQENITSGTYYYFPKGYVINDKTISYPQLYLSFSFLNGNRAEGNLVYRFYNFRVEPVSQGE